MSWLNFNDSLTNLRGQLSNLASGVLSDGETGDDTYRKKEEELEKLVTEQENEIRELRKLNNELQRNLGNSNISNVSQQGDANQGEWSWVESSQISPLSSNDEIVANLKKQVVELECEKKDLISSLEQLDLDCQQTTEKVITLKDALQVEYNNLQEKFDILNQDYKKLLKFKEQDEKTIGNLQGKVEELDKVSSSDNGTKFIELQRKNEEMEKLLNSYETKIQEIDMFMQNKEIYEQTIKSLDNKIENMGKSRDSETKEFETKLFEFQKQIENLTLEKENLQENLKFKNSENENLLGLLSEYKTKIQNFETSRSADQEEFNNIAKLREHDEKTIQILQEQIAEFSLIENKLKDIEVKYFEAQKKNEEIKLKNEELQQLLNLSNSEKEKLLGIISENELKIKNYQSSRISDQEEYDKLAKILQGYENQVKIYKEKSIRLESEINMSKVNVNDEHDSSNHVQILRDVFEKFMDYPLPNSESAKSFLDGVEIAMKHALELKYKSETLQKQLDALMKEQSEILNAKNDEIERLLENSELLSQEVMEKNEALKHYEEERHQLMKNNDLLIAELEAYRNNSGLHTISESNEDNLILLENQLESANKRVKELEEILNRKNAIESDLEKTITNYQNILDTFNKKDVQFSNVNEETDSVPDNVNIDMETLKEEVENLHTQIGSLTKQNKKLEEGKVKYLGENELNQKEIDDLKQTLSVELQMREELESEVRLLTEKLQNIKMSETTLKVHYDKEMQTLLESNKNINLKLEEIARSYNEAQDNLEKVNFEHAELTINYKSLEDEYKQIKAVLNDKEKELISKNEDILNLTNNISRLKTENEMLQLSNRNTASEETRLLIEEKSKLEEKITMMINDQEKNRMKTNELEQINTQLEKNYSEKIVTLESTITELQQNTNNLISNLKLKHEESQKYYTEIQRLNQILHLEVEKNLKLENEIRTKSEENPEIMEQKSQITKLNEEFEKLTEQNMFLKSKCEVLAQTLIEEQQNNKRTMEERSNLMSEKEASLSRELQRLRQHLLEIEDQHTQEMMLADKRSSELQGKMIELEQREKEATSLHTSVNIRTNQHVETLQNQLQLVTNQRDDLKRKLAEADDKINKQTAGLNNLEFVLRQFQEDKEKAVRAETGRIRRQIEVEKGVQEELRKELLGVRNQLDESRQGLLAASRLNDQVAVSKQQVASLKEQVQKLEDELRKVTEQNLSSNPESKVDKLLIKNLIVGFVGSNNRNLSKDQQQILKIISTVLDFNQQDNDKVRLNKSTQGSWLNAILHPNALSESREMSQESFSQAFIRFLENESKPRQLPNLLDTSQPVQSLNSMSQLSMLNEVVLPTFADFGQSRSSSSILKDVLKDNNN